MESSFGALDLGARLTRVSTADAADILRKRGITRVIMRHLSPQVPPASTTKGSTVAGRARTLRFLPDREDLTGAMSGSVHRTLYDGLQPGEALVIDGMGRSDAAIVGDMMLARIRARGASMVVVDGAVRDHPTISRESLPVFARGTSPSAFMGELRAWEADIVIQCGGVLVMPNDWVLADADGIVVIPEALAQSVASEAEAQVSKDAFSQSLLAAGFPLDDSYPLPPHMKGFLEEFNRSGALPDGEAVARARAKQSLPE